MGIPLSYLKKGEKGKVIALDSGIRARNKILAMGINIGSEIEVLESRAFQPLIIWVNGNRIAIGRGLASKIIVEKV